MKSLCLIGLVTFVWSAWPLAAASSEGSASLARELAAIPKNVKGPIARSTAEAAVASRQWREKVSLDYYEKHGVRDARWDANARQALKDFAARGTLTDSKAIADGEARLEAALRAVKRAGGNDPLLNYLFVRVARIQDGVSWKTYAEEMQSATDALLMSQAPCQAKLWACLRTAEALENAVPDKKSQSPRIRQLRDSAVVEMFHILRDVTLPAGEFYDAVDGASKFFKPNKAVFGEVVVGLEPIVLGRWPDDPRAQLTMGDFYVDYAWNGRGGGYAEKVTDQGWKDFESRLVVAEKYLEKAWKLDPTDSRIAVKMMAVELGQGKGRERMELWFSRAIKLAPNSSLIAQSKLNYLAPKWHGTPQAMLQFGRECVTNTAWGGNIPLTLVDAHRQLAGYVEPKERQAEYWKQPMVWRDLKLAYDRYFKDQPTASRQTYIRYAYWCEQWEVVNREIKALEKPNYSLFGGKEEFDKMVRTAAEKAVAK